MGRAIDMENKIDALRVEVDNLQEVLKTILSVVEGDSKIEQKKKETNDNGDNKSSGKSNSRKSSTNSKKWFFI